MPEPTPEPIPPPAPGAILQPERWRERPVFTIVTIEYSAAHRANVQEAIDEWNATGAVALTLGDNIPDDPNTTDVPNLGYGVIPFVYAPSVAQGITAPNYDADGYINRAWIGMNPETVHFARMVAHELGHVFGLQHPPSDNETPTIMDNWTLLAPTAYDLAQMAERYG